MKLGLEFDTFQLLIDRLREAASACRQLGFIRGDRRWHAIADALDKMVDTVYDLSHNRSK